jgi:hypothetical protein
MLIASESCRRKDSCGTSRTARLGQDADPGVFCLGLFAEYKRCNDIGQSVQGDVFCQRHGKTLPFLGNVFAICQWIYNKKMGHNQGKKRRRPEKGLRRGDIIVGMHKMLSSTWKT